MDGNKKNILIGFVVFVLEILLFYYLWENNVLLAVSLAAVSIVVLAKFSGKEERILYLVCFALGPIFDLTLVPRGVWSYANPTLFGVPVWLPFTYGLGTAMIVKIGNAIARLT